MSPCVMNLEGENSLFLFCDSLNYKELTFICSTKYVLSNEVELIQKSKEQAVLNSEKRFDPYRKCFSSIRI